MSEGGFEKSKNISETPVELLDVHKRISQIDTQISQAARAHMSHLMTKGYEASAMETFNRYFQDHHRTAEGAGMLLRDVAQDAIKKTFEKSASPSAEEVWGAVDDAIKAVLDTHFVSPEVEDPLISGGERS